MKTKEIGAFEAKTRLSELLERVGPGPSLHHHEARPPCGRIASGGRPNGIGFGSDEGRITIGDDAPAVEYIAEKVQAGSIASLWPKPRSSDSPWLTPDL